MSLSMSVPGAVAGDPPDDAVAAHFGDPTGEQRALDTGSAVVDRGQYGVVVVEGPDRLTWLHALTTQAFDRLEAGVAVDMLILSPHGHVEHQAVALDDGVRTWLIVEPGAAPPLVTFLTRMQFFSRVEVRDESARIEVFTVCGPLAAPGCLPQAVQAPVRVPRRWPPDSVDLLVAREQGDVAWSGLLAAGARPAGHDAYEALRVAAGVARAGVDSDHRTLVHEVGWVETAVHLDKGCYRGQETVARVHNLGRPPRRLVAVHIDGSEHLLPARGVAVSLDGRAIGTLTSTVRHYELGPIGLALIKRSVPDTARLVTDEGIAVAIDRDLSSPTQPVDLSGIRG